MQSMHSFTSAIFFIGSLECKLQACFVSLVDTAANGEFVLVGLHGISYRVSSIRSLRGKGSVLRRANRKVMGQLGSDDQCIRLRIKGEQGKEPAAVPDGCRKLKVD